MQTFSHHEPTIAKGSGSEPEILLLADAFAEFISASTRLESSYATLQHEVLHLSHELADRNHALKLSLAENERVHGALQQIVDSMPCGVLVVQGDGAVSMINPEGRRLLNLGSEPADHIKAISLHSGINLDGFLKRSTQADDQQEFCRSSSTGKHWLAVHERSLSHGSVHDAAGCQDWQTILILRDVTLHKVAESERERARRATSLSEVAMTLAHEIRNPLASLELFAALIERGGAGADEWVSHLRAGIRSLSATVNNVLSFHGLGFPALRALDLSQSIRSSVDFTRPIAEQEGVSLTFCSEVPGIHVQANASALQQVVLNLLCNAIRHSKEQGSIFVTIRKTGAAEQESAVIEVADCGSGIAPEHIGDIFRPGFSGSGDTSGLGLAVCRQIVEQHDGAIHVSSQLGIGSTFRVEIPALCI